MLKAVRMKVIIIYHISSNYLGYSEPFWRKTQLVHFFIS